MGLVDHAKAQLFALHLHTFSVGVKTSELKPFLLGGSMLSLFLVPLEWPGVDGDGLLFFAHARAFGGSANEAF